MAEAWVATFKAELVDGRPFSLFEYAEHQVLDWIGFYNDERLTKHSATSRRQSARPSTTD
jgi:hypothetical protein